jgi:uncharacterized protein (TIGR02145 family)
MKSLIFVSIFILNVLSAYSATEPFIKIYMNDGSSKQYKINDIAEINFINPNRNTIMKVFWRQSNIYFNDSTISAIKFRTFNNNQYIYVYLFGNSNEYSYALSNIDSICFYNIVFGEMVDIDNNKYKTVKIGNQEWMAENLNVSHYRNGDSIRYAESSSDWVDAGKNKEGAWCYYENYPPLGKMYGKLYNYYAVIDPRGLAPIGWHIATTPEWNSLIYYLEGDSIAGGKIKEIGTVHWGKPNKGASNSSGFTALPGGYRLFEGSFSYLFEHGCWWTSSPMVNNYADLFMVGYNDIKLEYYRYFKEAGQSVRCIKDK